MKKQVVPFLVVMMSLVVAQASYAASSISTRVKVVEEKVRLHDKKIRELKAGQERIAKQTSSAGANGNGGSAAAAAKAKQDAQVKAQVAAAIRAKQREEAKRLEAEQEMRAAQARVDAVKKRYAFP